MGNPAPLSDTGLVWGVLSLPPGGGAGQTLLDGPRYRKPMAEDSEDEDASEEESDEEEKPSRPVRPPPSPRASMSRTLMFMMFFLTLFVILDPNLRNLLASAANAVFYPTIGMGTAFPVITILLAGSLTTIISSLLRHVFTDWIKMTRVNKQMGSLRKAQMEALRRGNPAKVQKLRELQREMQAQSMDVTFSPMKSMAFTMLLFIVIFAWLSTFVYLYAVQLGHVYFAVPWQYNVDLRASYGFPAWVLLYSLLAIPVGQVVTRLLRFLQFRKRLAARQAEGG